MKKQRKLSVFQAARTLTSGLRAIHGGFPGEVFHDRRRNDLYWRCHRDGWSTLRYFSVTEYLPGLIRLRNDLRVYPPQRWWPMEPPQWRPFELTFHQSEITWELGEAMRHFCGALTANGIDPEFKWPLFDGQTAFPQYAWTKTALEFYEGNK